MKRKTFTLLIILALAFGVLGVIPAFAQAYSTSFTTSITYQNVDTQEATSVQVYFYPDVGSTTPIIITRPPLPAGAGTSLFIGSLTEIDQGFQGSAIMLADRRLVATLVQLPQSTTVKNRPLSNGFESGTPTILLATVQKNNFAAQYNSVFSVQNTDTEPNTITVTFYDTSANDVHTISQLVQDGASYYVNTGTITQLGTSFNGSAVVTAERSGGADGSIVATVMEMSANGPNTAAFESVSGGDTTFYMPSAICDAFGGQRSAYAVQNTSLTDSTYVRVTYSNGATDGATIGAGAKASFIACNASGMVSNYSGSAVIESLTSSSSSTPGQPIVAIGKVFGNGIYTAHLGADSGAAKLALPYVRWTQTHWFDGTRQRTNIAIQNVSGGTIPANALSVTYYDRDGVAQSTQTFNAAIPDGEKVNSRPYWNSEAAMAEFGYYASGFGGSAVVECDTAMYAGCQVVAIARVSSFIPADGSQVGEDYNGIPVP